MAPTDARSGAVGPDPGGAGRAARAALLVAVLIVLPLSNTIAVASLRSRQRAAGPWWVHHFGLLGAHAALVVLVLLWARRTGFDLGLDRHRRAGLTVVAASLVVAAVAVVGARVTPLDRPTADFGSFSREAMAFSLLAIVWAGVGQEILFRGFATGVLVEMTGTRWLAVGTTSLSFALYHGGLALGAANMLLNLWSGIVLGTVYVRTHDTWLVAAIHATFVAALLLLASTRAG
jgi:membrane protease YdiL (CAAX protease family)